MSGNTTDKLNFDMQYLPTGGFIAGMDEVGRGPLAGPVVCAIAIMPSDADKLIDGVDDSKKVSEKKRILLADKIKQTAIDYAICQVSPERIDEINILNATVECMQCCVKSLKTKVDMLLVDAVKADFGVPTQSIIKGDANSYAIGCASIIAKVYRDNLMTQYAKIYPQYGFEKHKGYGTKQHIEALKAYGATAIHRKTFIKKFIKVDI